MKSQMYSLHAQKYDLAIQDNIYNAHLERPSLQAMLEPLANLDVIDLGCGSGVYAEFLLGQGVAKLTCIDASAAMINIVRNKFAKRVVSYVQDLSIGLPQEASNSADVIICPLVVHYIENLSLLFQDVHRVLKTGGYMVFSTHHPFTDFDDSLSGNYFECEKIMQIWDTVGEPVEVVFYRRSLTELIDGITTSDLMVSQLSEGKGSEKVKQISLKQYNYLSTHPNFIFVKCYKPN